MLKGEPGRRRRLKNVNGDIERKSYKPRVIARQELVERVSPLTSGTRVSGMVSRIMVVIDPP